MAGEAWGETGSEDRHADADHGHVEAHMRDKAPRYHARQWACPGEGQDGEAEEGEGAWAHRQDER
jgi:hypothetical protein